MIYRNGTNNNCCDFGDCFRNIVSKCTSKSKTSDLIFIRFNQAKLRSEEYIHLRDAISTEEDTANVGRFTIPLATYTGSPRQMHEYAQDAMTYVRHYVRPDLFITFTCNPKWIEIVQMMLPGKHQVIGTTLLHVSLSKKSGR